MKIPIIHTRTSFSAFCSCEVLLCWSLSVCLPITIGRIPESCTLDIMASSFILFKWHILFDCQRPCLLYSNNISPLYLYYQNDYVYFLLIALSFSTLHSI